jgi:hypothetical protein
MAHETWAKSPYERWPASTFRRPSARLHDPDSDFDSDFDACQRRVSLHGLDHRSGRIRSRPFQRPETRRWSVAPPIPTLERL